MSKNPYLLEKVEHKNLEIQVFYDDDPLHPRRDCDHVTRMMCFHKRYNLGDEHDYLSDNFASWDDFRDELEEDFDIVVIKPVFMYDHSGVTINTTGFSCPWDSGQIGWIFIDRAEARKWFGWKRISKKRIKWLEKILVDDVEEYDTFLMGQVYRYEIVRRSTCSDCGQELEETIEVGCGGYYDRDEMLKDAKAAIDSLAKGVA